MSGGLTAVREWVARAWAAVRVLASALGAVAWASPWTAALAVLAGTAVGVGGYHLGVEVAAALVGLGAVVLTLGGVWRAPFARLLAPAPDEV